MKKPTLSYTHCQVTQSQPHKPKLGNKYVFANTEREANRTIKKMTKPDQLTMVKSGMSQAAFARVDIPVMLCQ